MSARERISRAAPAMLLALGLAQMAGDVLGVPAIKAIAAATAASPAPKVFSAVRGLETYSTRFRLEWIDRTGARRSRELDATARLSGPYNRRNVYGAALAFGPVLASDARTRPMLDAVMSYALGGDAPLLRELGIDPRDVASPVAVVFEPLAGTDMGALPRRIVAPRAPEPKP